MSIELSRDHVQVQLSNALKRHMATWTTRRENISEKVAELMTEVIFDVAGTASLKDSRRGVAAGIAMVRNWTA